MPKSRQYSQKRNTLGFLPGQLIAFSLAPKSLWCLTHLWLRAQRVLSLYRLVPTSWVTLGTLGISQSVNKANEQTEMINGQVGCMPYTVLSVGRHSSIGGCMPWATLIRRAIEWRPTAKEDHVIKTINEMPKNNSKSSSNSVPRFMFHYQLPFLDKYYIKELPGTKRDQFNVAL